jgi:hypothetical protein
MRTCIRHVQVQGDLASLVRVATPHLRGVAVITRRFGPRGQARQLCPGGFKMRFKIGNDCWLLSAGCWLLAACCMVWTIRMVRSTLSIRAEKTQMHYQWVWGAGAEGFSTLRFWGRF